MKNKFHLVILITIGLIVSLSAAYFLPVPGFMDAEYYYSGGVMLFSGKGFNENFIWNFLDNPSTLPHPAFTYWMPFPSILAALGMWLGGSSGFFPSRIIFIILASSIPIITYIASLSFSNNPQRAFISGIFAAFPIFYITNLANTETFAIYMILGWLFINVAFSAGHNLTKQNNLRFLYLGLMSGFLHLTRADGFLWLLAAVAISIISTNFSQPFSIRGVLAKVTPIIITLLGYSIIMFPWYFRNFSIYGYLFPPGNSRGLWLIDYNQLFSFPASKLTFHNWLASGWENIFQSRLDAFISNFQTFFAVQGEIILFPLSLMGLWKYRLDHRVRFSVIMWGMIFILMTIVFPFAGLRGGFFHSGSAFQIVFWVMAAEGLAVFIDLGRRYRNWIPIQSWRVFSSFSIILLISLSFFIFSQRVYGKNLTSMPWKTGWNAHKLIESSINSFGGSPGTIIMTNNPPGYFAATFQPSVVIPDGDEGTVLEAAEKFNVDFLVLENNHPSGLHDLYTNPKSKPGLLYLGSKSEIHFFKFQ